MHHKYITAKIHNGNIYSTVAQTMTKRIIDTIRSRDMREGMRQFDYNHKVDKLVSTHPLGNFICVRCKTERFEVGTKRESNWIYASDDGASMNASVGVNGQRSTL